MTDGMVIAPCSAKTLAAVRSGYGSDPIARAADVTHKEQRRPVMVVRGTPQSTVRR
ncbi:flavoprotein [Streptomyces sp. MMG1121]|uniref:flavoprotein n=1 Tax=Streptomyces sp. MMG1121 TaxID=1415544 RepID=UPI001F3CA2F7|nr:flavoprotein [Streptomyces sp. MMG1121]